MQQKIATAFIVLLALGLLTVVIIGSKKQLDTSSSATIEGENSQEETVNTSAEILAEKTPILFYGNTCPHCLEVEEWLQANEIEQKLEIIKKEVYDDRQNAQLLAQAAQVCGLATDNLAVPFLFAQKQCYVGKDQIEAYLSQTVNLSATDSGQREN